MNTIKKIFLSIFLILPLSAFAHGEEVLLVVFIPAISLIVLLIVLPFLKIQIACKMILFIIYIATLFCVFSYINDIPYRENMNKINLAIGIIPMLSVGLGYIAISLFKLRKNSTDH